MNYYRILTLLMFFVVLELLIFVNAIKLYPQTNSISDCTFISFFQNDLTNLMFSILFLPFLLSYFPYVIHNIPTKPSSDSIYDLGFKFTRDLFPNKHIEDICCTTLKILGFVLCSSPGFQLLSPLKTYTVIEFVLVCHCSLGPLSCLCQCFNWMYSEKMPPHCNLQT